MRYILFSGSHCYPSGGVHDLKASSDNIQELLDNLVTLQQYDREWWHIFDTVEYCVVEEGGEKW